MTTKCTYGVDCPRPANERTGRCDLHDAIVMTEEARELLMKVLVRLDVRARKDQEVEHCESPRGNPHGTLEAGTSHSICPDGLSERSTESIACARCGRELRSLEQIRAALELAPGEALGEGQTSHPKDAYSFALGHLTCAVGEAVRDLACHSGACRRGML